MATDAKTSLKNSILKEIISSAEPGSGSSLFIGVGRPQNWNSDPPSYQHSVNSDNEIYKSGIFITKIQISAVL